VGGWVGVCVCVRVLICLRLLNIYLSESWVCVCGWVCVALCANEIDMHESTRWRELTEQ